MIVDNKYYKFKYPKIRVSNVSLAKEIERYNQHQKIRKNILSKFKKYKISPKKGNLKTNVNKVIYRFIISNLSQKILKLKDGLYHHNNNEEFFKKDISTIFKINEIQLKKLIKEINICSMFDKAIENISNCKNVKITLYKENKSKRLYLHTDISPKLYVPNIVKKKLKTRYLEYKKHNKVISFDDAVYILLLRYHTLDSGNQQSGMPYLVRDKFKSLDYNFECFASSLNHHLKYYCSMFYDIEKIFMSLGFFQNITYIKGNYMANPPYELNLLNNLVDTVIKSCKSKQKITFMYGLPDWERFNAKFEFLEKTKNSKYKKYQFKLPPFKFTWVNFMEPDSVVKIPSSYRFVLSNEKIEKNKHHEINKYWGKL